MRDIKVGEMIWSHFLNEWVKVVRVDSDDDWYFMIKGGVIWKAQTKLSVFAKKEQP